MIAVRKYAFARICSFLLLMLYAASAQGQPEASVQRLDGSRITAAQIDRTVTQLMDSGRVEGLSLAILNRNRVVYQRAYGFRNKSAGALLDTATILYGASFSKAVFGVIVMQLAERGLLSLDTPLYAYLKQPLDAYPYFAELASDPRYKRITARMCLSHTTGLPNIRYLHPTTGAQDTAGVLRLYFDPGTRYAYSGEGLRLLQLAVEERMGKPLDPIAQELVFDPAGMRRTGYVWHGSFDDNVSVGHLPDGRIVDRKHRTVAIAPGSLLTTIPDYARFISWLLQGKAMTRASFGEMIRPQIAIRSVHQFPPILPETTTDNDRIHLSYGLGWGCFKGKYGRAFFKEGNSDGFKNYNVNFPDRGTSIIIMTNSEQGEGIFRYLLERLIGDRETPWFWEGYIPYDQAKG